MKKTTIIAEAGVNHNGSLELALRMIDAAAAAGADAVKFQTFDSSKMVTRSAAKAGYQQANTGGAESQYEMLRRLEMGGAELSALMEHCRRAEIAFLSTPFESGSLALLLSLGLETIKIPSGELTNLPFLREIGNYGKEVILSTGMATLSEVADALRALEDAGTARERITLLHCTTDYPARPDEVNLFAMNTLRAAFPGLAGVGYSDHTDGIDAALAATALGATIIEKHFTLDKGMSGPDHRASLEPAELADMCRAIRRVERMLGDGIKRPSASEKANIPVARKSILAGRAIAAGEFFSAGNISTKRPGDGLSPMRWDELLGRRAKRGYAADEPIDPAELDGGEGHD